VQCDDEKVIGRSEQNGKIRVYTLWKRLHGDALCGRVFGWELEFGFGLIITNSWLGYRRCVGCLSAYRPNSGDAKAGRVHSTGPKA
jgi:hypothetical protein